MELLRNGRNFLVRVRTTDGAEGLAVPNADRLIDTYPIFLNRVAPFFVGKDARELEPICSELYRHDDNYKSRGWPCGSAWRPPSSRSSTCSARSRASRSATCWAASGGARSPSTGPAATGATRREEEIEYLKKLIAETGAKALKFRLGGRMSKNADSLARPHRAADSAGAQDVRRPA